MKINTTVSVDSDLLERARKKGYNVSRLLNQKLAESTGQSVMSNENLECSFCGRVKLKASRSQSGLYWLCPDEKWCCEACLRGKVSEIVIGIVPA